MGMNQNKEESNDSEEKPKENSEKDSCNSSTSSVTNNPLKQGGQWQKVNKKGRPDSGCDTASSYSGGSNRRNSNKFDRAPGAGRKSVKMLINISASQVSPITRQPRGPTTASGFAL